MRISISICHGSYSTRAFHDSRPALAAWHPEAGHQGNRDLIPGLFLSHSKRMTVSEFGGNVYNVFPRSIPCRQSMVFGVIRDGASAVFTASRAPVSCSTRATGFIGLN